MVTKIRIISLSLVQENVITMKVKRFLTVTALFFLAWAAAAQTPEDILSHMEEVFDKHESEGLVMTMDVKIPILGTTSSQVYALGDKMRAEVSMMGVAIIIWSDGVTEWEYNSKNNEVEIKKDKGSSENGDAELFGEISDGYDVSIKKETADAWHLICRKSKTNTDKDAPKTIDLVVAKETYMPLSLSAKVSGFTMTMRDIRFGVTEEQVTFNAADYPGVKIIDKR